MAKLTKAQKGELDDILSHISCASSYIYHPSGDDLLKARTHCANAMQLLRDFISSSSK